MKRNIDLDSKLYCILSEEHSLGRTAAETAAAMLEGGARIIQYREKNKPKMQRYLDCLRLRRMTRRRGCLFIVNDDVDIARAVGADGAHIGQEDIPMEAARAVLGRKAIIGVSTHSPLQAREAELRGADYIGVGPIYRTATKRDVCPAVGLEYLDYAVRNVRIPFVAIGGIKLRSLPGVLGRGARCAALVTEITMAPDIAGTVKQAAGLIKEACRARGLAGLKTGG